MNTTSKKRTSTPQKHNDRSYTQANLEYGNTFNISRQEVYKKRLFNLQLPNLKDQRIKSLEITLKQLQSQVQPLFTENSQLKSHIISQNYFIEERKLQLSKLLRDTGSNGEDRIIIKAVADLKEICNMIEEELLTKEGEFINQTTFIEKLKKEIHVFRTDNDKIIHHYQNEKQIVIDQMSQQAENQQESLRRKDHIIEKLVTIYFNIPTYLENDIRGLFILNFTLKLKSRAVDFKTQVVCPNPSGLVSIGREFLLDLTLDVEGKV